MGCVFREHPHECADDCPFCCPRDTSNDCHHGVPGDCVLCENEQLRAELAALREPESVVSPDEPTEREYEMNVRMMEMLVALVAIKQAALDSSLDRIAAILEGLSESAQERLDARAPTSLDDRVKKLEWREESAKGGGLDVFADGFTIQDDLDRGGWNLYVDKIHVSTLDEAKSLSQTIQSLLSSPTSVGGGE